LYAIANICNHRVQFAVKLSAAVGTRRHDLKHGPATTAQSRTVSDAMRAMPGDDEYGAGRRRLAGVLEYSSRRLVLATRWNGTLSSRLIN
jgi:hypothetical protein